MALSAENRLNKKKDFDWVFRKGNAVRGNFLFIRHVKNTLNKPRFGFIIPAKVFKKAVDRNKVKRKLSECVRTDWLQDINNYDIVITANKKGETKDILTELVKLLGSINR